MPAPLLFGLILTGLLCLTIWLSDRGGNVPTDVLIREALDNMATAGHVMKPFPSRVGIRHAAEDCWCDHNYR